MSFLSPKTPSAPPPPPPPPAPPNPGTPAAATQLAGAAERQAAALAGGAGFDNTITNAGGAAGLSSQSNERKPLLGS